MKNSLILIVLAAFIFLYGGCKYNGMVKTDEGVKLKWGNVQSEYQRRADLIPNIVEAVKGEASFEKSVLEGVINHLLPIRIRQPAALGKQLVGC